MILNDVATVSIIVYTFKYFEIKKSKIDFQLFSLK